MMRRALALGVCVVLLAASCSGGGDEANDGGGADIDAELPRLPRDPVDAAERLVELIHSRDEGLARAATVELLRRSGVPVVAADGPMGPS